MIERGRIGSLLGVLWATLSLLPAVCAAETPPPAVVRRLLTELSDSSQPFDSAEIRRYGVEGLAAVLDCLWPETAALPADPGERAALELAVRQLNHPEFAVRTAATQRLILAGPSAHSLLDQLPVAEPEVRRRMRFIRRIGSPAPEWAGYPENWRVCLDGWDDPAVRGLVAQRAAAVLDHLPEDDPRRQVLRVCVGYLAASGEDRWLEPLERGLDHPDPTLTLLIVRGVGSDRPTEFMPQLLLAALRSERKEVVAEALEWVPNCRDEQRTAEVLREVRRIFQGQDDSLKFQAAFPLLHDFHDPEAIAYLLDQAGAKDKIRAVQALRWLGDSANYGRQLPEGMIARLQPQLTAADDTIRQAAVIAIGIYGGAEVVQTLIPFLADEDASVASKAMNLLIGQPDKEALWAELGRAAETHPNRTVRSNAVFLLKLRPKK